MKRLGSPGYLFTGFFIITMLVLTQSVIALFHAYKTRHYVEIVIDTHNRKVRALNEMQNIVLQRMQLLDTMMIVRDPKKLDALHERFLALSSHFSDKRDVLMDDGGSEKERRLKHSLLAMTVEGSALIEQAVTLASSGNYDKAKQILLGTLQPMHERFVQQSGQLQDVYLKSLSEVARRAEKADESWRRYTMVFGMVMVFLTMFIARIVIRRIDADRQALLVAQDTLEEAVAERTAELQQTAGQLKEAQRVAHLGHWEWDISSGGLKWSDEIYRIFGVSPGQYAPSYEAFLNAVHPDDRNLVTTAVERAVNGEEEYSVEHRVVWPDGSTRCVHEYGEVRYDEDGSPLSMLGAVQDITERKESEKRQLLAASVYHNTGDGVMITDADNNIVEINESFSEILGYRIEDILGRNPRVLQSGRHDPAFFQALWHSINETGQWQGEIWDRRKQGDILPLWMTINAVRDEQGILNNYVALFRDISKVKENEQSLWKLAHHDPLTGLANRSLMYARLQLAMSQSDREQGGVALLMIDLDGFKQVNDTLGHSAGDELLLKVADVLRNKVRESDTVARYAGDEFVILLKGLQERSAVQRIAAEIVDALSSPFTVSEGEAHIGASIGVSIYPTHAFDAESLIAKADQAMYRAKKQGKAQVCFFGDW